VQQSDRERFKALIDAKRNKGGGGAGHGHGDDRRGPSTRDVSVKQTFKQRKV